MVLSVLDSIKDAFSGPVVIVGTILGAIAVMIFIFSALIKSKKKIILVQCLAHIFLAISEGISKLFSAIVQEVISLTRNIAVYFNKNPKWFNISLISLGTGLGIYANIFGENFFTPWQGIDIQGWYAYLPVIANLQFSIIMMNPNLGAKWLKLAVGLNGVLWSVSFLIQGGAVLLSGILNAISGIVNLVAFFIIIIRERKNKNENLEENVNINE